VVDGLEEALVRQGAASFRLWTGLEPPLDVMRKAVGTDQANAAALSADQPGLATAT
jgi:shikimate 5-dehydrogenase